MRQEIYIANELSRFHAECLRYDKAPIHERREAKRKLLEHLNTTQGIEHFTRSAEWLINGTYGAGPYFAFCSLSKRSNRPAWLFNYTAQLEYMTSNEHARKAWHELDKNTQESINSQLQAIIDAFDEEESEVA